MIGPMTLLLAVAAIAAEPAADVTEPPPYAEFIVVPLRVHVLSAADLPEVDCGLSDDDIARILGKVNGIWHMAGIHFGLESLRREPAAELDRFKLLRETIGEAELGVYTVLAPADSRRFAGLHVYYVHKLPVNGVHFGGDFAFVQEVADLRRVEGGIDEPLPRVTAHELGHALSLPHRQAETNLLASGTTGTLLDEDEVKQAREAALHLAGALAVAELRLAALQAVTDGNATTAQRLWSWLAEIPGEGAEEARQQLKDIYCCSDNP
jgi:hypothetical protein